MSLTPDQLSERRESDELAERYLGPVVGELFVEQVTNGGHPDWVLTAWTGNSLHLRRGFNRSIGHIAVYCYDGFNALVDGGAEERVLDYWMQQLNSPLASISDQMLFDETSGQVQLHNENH
ncbi:MAG: hypothetical protein ABIP74_03905 [Candidatus Saccharimonas sp.]